MEINIDCHKGLSRNVDVQYQTKSLLFGGGRVRVRVWRVKRPCLCCEFVHTSGGSPATLFRSFSISSRKVNSTFFFFLTGSGFGLLSATATKAAIGQMLSGVSRSHTLGHLKTIPGFSSACAFRNRFRKLFFF